MYVTIDTSALIAVIGNEESKGKIIYLTVGYSLCAPPSVHWEIGNAFSAMFKRRSSSLDHVLNALEAYQEIPIRFIDVPLEKSIELSNVNYLFRSATIIFAGLMLSFYAI